MYIHVYHQGHFVRPVGDICPDEDTLVMDFVVKVIRDYGFETLPLSTLECYIFRNEMLVRVRSTGFLADNDVVYVCVARETDDLERSLVKKAKKEAKINDQKLGLVLAKPKSSLESKSKHRQERHSWERHSPRGEIGVS